MSKENISNNETMDKIFSGLDMILDALKDNMPKEEIEFADEMSDLQVKLLDDISNVADKYNKDKQEVFEDFLAKLCLMSQMFDFNKYKSEVQEKEEEKENKENE